MTLTPAYGRDYKSKKEVQAAFDAGQDFIIADAMHPYSGKPVCKSQLAADGEHVVMIRFAKLTKVQAFRVQ